MLILKKRNAGHEWITYHHKHNATPEDYYMVLHGAGVANDNATTWQDTAPTSTVYSIGTYTDINASGGTMVAYAWRSIQGFSKFGSFIGNGNADGPFVYLGFRPAMVIVKDTGAAVGWGMYDHKRNGYNDNNRTLYAHSDSGEDAGGYVNLLSNGFKITSSSAWQNRSGGEFIYVAFAEAPFVNSNGVPCNAR